MPLDLQSYDIHVARAGLDLDKAVAAGPGDGYDTHRVMVLHADRLVAEQAGPRYGLPKQISDAPQAWATLWCWVALRRMGVEVPEFPPFKTQVIDIDLVKAADAEVDPTTPPPDIGSP